MYPIHLYVFGTPRLERQGQPVEVRPRKAFAILIYLAVTGRSHSRDTLAVMFWPESSQSHARASLRRTLHRLTQSLQANILDTRGDAVGIAAHATLWLDCRTYRDTLERYMPAGGPVANASLPHLIEAADLYTGDFLTGFSLPDSPSFDEWQFFQQEDLRRTQGRALEAVVTGLECAGKLEQARHYAHLHVALDPLDEAAHRRLIRLYAQTGQQAAAMRQYQKCHRILNAELGVPPGTDTQALYEAVKSRSLAAQPAPPPEQPATSQPSIAMSLQVVHDTATERAPYAAIPCNLAPQPTPFIGRVAELAQVRHLLVDETGCRLLVLVGPGGIGKTRLALQAAKELAHLPASSAQFPDGVYFIPLASVTTPTGIVQAVAETLKLPLFDNTPRERQLYDYLRNKRLLFVLDNYEHLSGAATKISEMLAALPGIKLLVTSREGVALQEAWFLPLSGLSFPSTSNAALPAARDYEAMRLFEQSARRIDLDFSLEREQEHVAEICRLVGGMPLALEMSVAWLRVLQAADIAKELGRNLDLLTAEFQNFPDRHRSMRVVIEQSWAMLADDETDALMRLSVFAGGFGKEAAEQVAGASLRILARLVDKSFLSVDGAARYHLHELVRRYAAERLDEDPDQAAATKSRHSAYYLAFLTARDAALIHTWQIDAYAEVYEKFDNILLAWQWAVEQRDAAAIEKATMSFWRVHWRRNRGEETAAILGKALEGLLETPTAHGSPRYEHALALLYHYRGLCWFYLGDYLNADADLQAALERARRLGEKRAVADVMRLLGVIAGRRGRWAAAQEHLEQSITLACAVGDQAGTASAQIDLVVLFSRRGDYAKALAIGIASLATSRRFERRDLIAYALDALGWLMFCLGDYRQARAYYEESVANFRASDHRLGTALALGGLGVVAWGEGGKGLTDALAFFDESLTICRRLGNRLHIASRLTHLAQVYNDLGRHEEALVCAQEGLALAVDVGSPDMASYLHFCLAEATYRLGDRARAVQHLTTAHELAMEYDLRPRLAIVLYGWARFLEGEILSPDPAAEFAPDDREHAVALLRAVIGHPATWPVFRRRAQAMLSRLQVPTGMKVAASVPAASVSLEQTASVWLQTIRKRQPHLPSYPVSGVAQAIRVGLFGE